MPVRKDATTGPLRGYFTPDSSNVRFVGWLPEGMLVWFKHGQYLYKGVTRQRAVACALAPSVGSYINQRIKGQFETVRL